MARFCKIEIKTETVLGFDSIFKVYEIIIDDENEIKIIKNSIVALKEALRLAGLNKKNIDKLL